MFKAIVLCELYNLSDDQVEHVFGAQSNDMGGTLVRGIGLVRARARIGLKNLAYNMRRLVQLERLAAAAPTGRSSGETSAWSPH